MVRPHPAASVSQARKKGSFGKGVFPEKSIFLEILEILRDSRDSRDFREPPDSGKQRRIRPSSRDSREFGDFRDSRDFSSEETPFAMTPFPVPSCGLNLARWIFRGRHGCLEDRSLLKSRSLNFGHFLRGSSSQGQVAQLLAGTDAGTGVRGHVRVWGEFCCSAPQYGRGHGGGRGGTHTGTHTGTYTRMLHLPFSDLPLKKCPKTPLVHFS